MEKKRLEIEEEKKKIEEYELYLFRKSLETKARPLPNFESPFRPKPSEKEPTRPLSPLLETKKRKKE